MIRTAIGNFGLDVDVQQNEAVHGDSDRSKVDNGDINTSKGKAVAGGAVDVLVLKDDGSNSGDGLDDNILKNTVLHVVQEHIARGVVVEAVEGEHELLTFGAGDFGAPSFVVVA